MVDDLTNDENYQDEIMDVLGFYNKNGWDWTSLVLFLSWKKLGRPLLYLGNSRKRKRDIP